MASRLISVACAALLAACGPRESARSGGGDERAGAPIELEEGALDLLELPDLRGKPLVQVKSGNGSQLGVGLLIEDDDDGFTVFDGLDTKTFWAEEGGGYVDGELPRDGFTFQRIDGPRAARLLTTASTFRLKAIVLAFMLERQGQKQLAQAALQRLAKSTKELRAFTREGVSRHVARKAVQRYAKGGSRADFDRAMKQVAALEGTQGAAYAKHILAAFDAPRPPEPAATTPLDGLIWARVRALADHRCTGEVEPEGLGREAVSGVRSLGLNAREALLAVKDDPHPTRCIGSGFSDGDGLGELCAIDPEACAGPDGAGPPRLVTVGDLARRELKALAFKRAEIDLTDIECDRQGYGYDGEAYHLVDVAVAKHDIEQAIALTKGARGNLRAKMVERIGEAGRLTIVKGARMTPYLREVERRQKADRDASTPFLIEEAKGGPVLFSRMKAARALAERGDASHVASVASVIGDAIEGDDREPKRCDQDPLAFEGLSMLLRHAPAEGLAMVASRFSAFGPRARVRVLTSIRPLAIKTAEGERARSALFALALADRRPVQGLLVSWGIYTRAEGSRMTKCSSPSPSDIAALVLGERLGVPYACAGSAEDKALGVQAIEEKLGK